MLDDKFVLHVAIGLSHYVDYSSQLIVNNSIPSVVGVLTILG